MNGYIYDEVQRMNKLIEDFLVFSRPSVPNLKLISVDALADKMSQKISLIDGAITINNHVGECGGEGRELKCDIVQFERALLNVVRNAIEASKEAGQVTVAVFCTKKRLNFQVCDGGSGFDPAKAESMFEPFVSTKSKGTGLGLALVKDVIKAHKGSVAIKNRPEGGACFTLKLTLVDTDLNQSKEI
jgi:signal transduction histidine kinase